MSHIAIDAREYASSTGRYISNLIEQLQQIDTQNDYTILLKPKDIAACPITNPRFTKLGCPHKEYTFAEQLGFYQQLKQLQPDLVHFGKTEQPILYHGKKITTIHDLTTARFTNPAKNPVSFWIKQQVYKYVIKSVAKRSQAIFVPTAFVRDDLIAFSHVAQTKITVTHESGDAITTPPIPLPYLQNKKFIMYIGRPTPHKNLGRLTEAFSLLQADYPDLLLVLAGKKDANYERIAAEAPSATGKHIIFTNFVSEGQLRWLYEHCAAYVFPSLSEGFGLPGLEAMAHSAPVVSSNATCLPEVYGDAAHYFDPYDPAAIARAIGEVLTNDALHKSLVTAGHKQLKQYSWRKMAKETLAVYNSVLS